MNAEELLRKLNTSDERDTIEAKASSELGDPVMETICAFSNGPDIGEGFILAGVERTKSGRLYAVYSPTGVNNADRQQCEIVTRCSTMFNHPVRPKIDVERIQGRNVLVIRVTELHPSQKPLRFKNTPLPHGAFIRVGPTNQRCTDADISWLCARSDEDSFDISPVSGAKLDDIDPDCIRLFRTMRSEEKPDAEELQLPDVDLLRAYHCVTEVGGETVPTYCGLLFFASGTARKRYIPLARIDYSRMQGEHWIGKSSDMPFEKKTFLGPLIEQLQQARQAILDTLPTAYFVPATQLQRKELPRLRNRVVREIIANAVMHRDYRVHSPIQIIRYTNRFEVINTGYSRKPLETLNTPGSRPRNPHIASLLYDIGIGEQKGLGGGMVRRLMLEMGLAPPVFDSDRIKNEFSAFLLLRQMSEYDVERYFQALEAMGFDENAVRAIYVTTQIGAIDNKSLSTFLLVDPDEATEILRKAAECGAIVSKGSEGRRYFEPSGSFQLKNCDELLSKGDELLAKSDELVGKSNELGREEHEVYADIPEEIAQRIPENTRGAESTRRAILELCNWKALMPQELGYYLRRNTRRLVNDYISPMHEQGVLERTIPETPTHPAQKYRTTGLGVQEII